jgi:hypothetical protein
MGNKYAKKTLLRLQSGGVCESEHCLFLQVVLSSRPRVDARGLRTIGGVTPPGIRLIPHPPTPSVTHRHIQVGVSSDNWLWVEKGVSFEEI